MERHSQISRSSVHRWKLISGLGRGQSYSGPLDNGSTIHTHTYRGRERGKDQNGHNDTQNKTIPPALPLCPSLSLKAGKKGSRFTGWVANMIIVGKRVDVMEIDIRKIKKKYRQLTQLFWTQQKKIDRSKVTYLISAQQLPCQAFVDTENISICLNRTLNHCTCLQWSSSTDRLIMGSSKSRNRYTDTFFNALYSRIHFSIEIQIKYHRPI